MGRRVTVCGIPSVKIISENTYGGGHIYPGATAISRYARISKAEAKKLTSKLFGREKLPHMGYEMNLCPSTWLENTSGRFSIGRRASGDFQGARRRRKRR